MHPTTVTRPQMVTTFLSYRSFLVRLRVPTCRTAVSVGFVVIITDKGALAALPHVTLAGWVVGGRDVMGGCGEGGGVGGLVIVRGGGGRRRRWGL